MRDLNDDAQTAGTVQGASSNAIDELNIHPNAQKDNGEFSYSLTDLVTRSQAMAEREITGLLCFIPSVVLQSVGEWIPEVAQRERAFWKFVKAIPNLRTLSDDELIRILADIARRQGLYPEYLLWMHEAEEVEGGTRPEYITTRLVEIKALRDARRGFEILSKHQSWVMRAIYDR